MIEFHKISNVVIEVSKNDKLVMILYAMSCAKGTDFHPSSVFTGSEQLTADDLMVIANKLAELNAHPDDSPILFYLHTGEAIYHGDKLWHPDPRMTLGLPLTAEFSGEGDTVTVRHPNGAVPHLRISDLTLWEKRPQLTGKGLFSRRLRDPINKSERAFVSQWQEFTKDTDMNWLYGDIENADILAETIIQWLGTNVGQGFISKVNSTIENMQEDD